MNNMVNFKYCMHSNLGMHNNLIIVKSPTPIKGGGDAALLSFFFHG